METTGCVSHTRTHRARRSQSGRAGCGDCKKAFFSEGHAQAHAVDNYANCGDTSAYRAADPRRVCVPRVVGLLVHGEGAPGLFFLGPVCRAVILQKEAPRLTEMGAALVSDAGTPCDKRIGTGKDQSQEEQPGATRAATADSRCSRAPAIQCASCRRERSSKNGLSDLGPGPAGPGRAPGRQQLQRRGSPMDVGMALGRRAAGRAIPNSCAEASAQEQMREMRGRCSALDRDRCGCPSRVAPCSLRSPE